MTGGLGAGLGVVELTVAFYVFDTPSDKLIWDVGHQAYPHKIVTGRRDRIRTLRQGGGLSASQAERERIDPFGAAHSSTSISAALGFAIANKLSDAPGKAVAVIGDGALSAGMAGAMNNAAAAETASSSSSTTTTCPLRRRSDRCAMRSPGWWLEQVPRASQAGTDRSGHARAAAYCAPNGGICPRPLPAGRSSTSSVFIIGPGRWSATSKRSSMCSKTSAMRRSNPVLVHVVTHKGKKQARGEFRRQISWRGEVRRRVRRPAKAGTGAPSYTSVFAKALTAEAERDEKVVASAAMPSGTGLDKFAEKFPDRYFDVGIAEQHAVTFAAGLAAQGFRPFCAIYSTFLQRAYDQVVHDVAIRICRCASAWTGRPGRCGRATHAGASTSPISVLCRTVLVMAAADEVELVHMVLALHDGPIAVRYPRGEAGACNFPRRPSGWRSARAGSSSRDKVAILSLGTRLEEAEKAAEQRSKRLYVVADLRFAKPLDEELIRQAGDSGLR